MINVQEPSESRDELEVAALENSGGIDNIAQQKIFVMENKFRLRVVKAWFTSMQTAEDADTNASSRGN